MLSAACIFWFYFAALLLAALAVLDDYCFQRASYLQSVVRGPFYIPEVPFWLGSGFWLYWKHVVRSRGEDALSNPR